MKIEPNLYSDRVLLRVARGLCGMGQKQFARVLGVSAPVISIWENGHSPLPPRHRPKLIKILRDMNKEIKWFLAQEGSEGHNNV